MGALMGWMGKGDASPAVVSRIRQSGGALSYRVPRGYAMSGVMLSADRHAAGIGGPMELHRHDVIMLFDGRLDNLVALRQELACPVGEDIRGVLLAGWARYRTGLFARLQGPFALAIYDETARSWTCARDQYGQRPLYYASDPATFIFASDVRTLQTWPHLKNRIDLDKLAYVFSLGCAPPEFGLHMGISRLLPGHVLTVGSDLEVHVAPWPGQERDPEGTDMPPPAHGTTDKTLTRLLGNAVVAGTGHASALLMGTSATGRKADKALDLLRHLGSYAPKLHPVQMSVDQDDASIIERLRALQRIAGEPLVALLPDHAAFVPQYSDETVLVSPAGGAELLGVAPHYDLFLRDVVRLREEGRPPVWWKTSFYDVMPFIRDLFQHSHGGLTESERMTVIGPAMTHTLLFASPDALGPELEDVETAGLRRAAAELDMRTSLPGRELLVLDSVAALDGREAVAPFLASPVVRHCRASSQYDGSPARGGGVSSRLRELVERLARNYMHDTLTSTTCRKRGLFSTAQVERHLRATPHRSARSIRILWTMFCTELWFQDTIDVRPVFRQDIPDISIVAGHA